MNRQVTQQPPEVAQQQQQATQIQQLQSQKVISGVRTGIELLEDKTVTAPIAMHGGLTDLKWLLQNLLSGQFSLDLDPQGLKAPTGRPQTGRPLDEYPKDDEGPNGEDAT